MITPNQQLAMVNGVPGVAGAGAGGASGPSIAGLRILRDISMPEMDRCEFLQAARGMARYHKLPAIAISGLGRQKDIAHARGKRLFEGTPRQASLVFFGTSAQGESFKLL